MPPPWGPHLCTHGRTLPFASILDLKPLPEALSSWPIFFHPSESPDLLLSVFQAAMSPSLMLYISGHLPSWAPFPTLPDPSVFHEMGCLSEAKEIQLSQAHLPEQLHSSSLADTTHPPESCTGAITWKPWTWSTAGPGCPPWLSPWNSSATLSAFQSFISFSEGSYFTPLILSSLLLTKPHSCCCFGASFSHSQRGPAHLQSIPSSRLGQRTPVYPFQVLCFPLCSWLWALLKRQPEMHPPPQQRILECYLLVLLNSLKGYLFPRHQGFRFCLTISLKFVPELSKLLLTLPFLFHFNFHYFSVFKVFQLPIDGKKL